MVVAAVVVMAATALVQAIVTDGWEGVRHKVAALFGRGRPDPQIERRLDATRQQLTMAPPGDLARAQAAEASAWQIRFADLLAEQPGAEAELAALVEEIRAGLPVAVTAADHGVAAGRDVTVKAEGGSVAAAVIGGDVSLPGPPAPGPAGT